MFERLFGHQPAPVAAPLPAVRNITIGRTVMVDPLAWRRFGDELKFPFTGDTLQIVAQGLVELNEGGFVHRFYTDDEIMFQVVTNDRAGQDISDVTLFAPWDSQYPGVPADRDVFRRRLSAPVFTGPDLPDYNRLWFGADSPYQEPVSFWEDLHDDRDGIVDRRIFQVCMLFARPLGDNGKELLLAMDMETDAGDASFEIMLGVGLELGEFRA